MGAIMTSTGVHFRQDGTCKAAMVVNDSPHSDPPNLVFDLVVFNVSLDGDVSFSFHSDVLWDDGNPSDIEGRWHDHGAMGCPDQLA